MYKLNKISLVLMIGVSGLLRLQLVYYRDVQKYIAVAIVLQYILQIIFCDTIAILYIVAIFKGELHNNAQLLRTARHTFINKAG